MVVLELHSGMQVSKRSVASGELNTMVLDFTMPQYMDWKGGMLIQNAMPQLSADEREFLMTGMTPAEWNEMFA
jgi:hypothetical protein|tara:strand:- start:262 stop:480 length:219 start_codon:yes stop_codon:yes gene_type:complete